MYSLDDRAARANRGGVGEPEDSSNHCNGLLPTGTPVPDPRLVLEVIAGRLVWPAAGNLRALQQSPDWAKAIVESALSLPPYSVH